MCACCLQATLMGTKRRIKLWLKKSSRVPCNSKISVTIGATTTEIAPKNYKFLKCRLRKKGRK